MENEVTDSAHNGRNNIDLERNLLESMFDEEIDITLVRDDRHIISTENNNDITSNNAIFEGLKESDDDTELLSSADQGFQELSDIEESTNARCCLHDKNKNDSTENIKLFSDETLEKCRHILLIRKKQNLKYKEIFLPESTDGYSGYHRECYKRFTAVPKTSQENSESEDSKEDSKDVKVTRSHSKIMKTSDTEVYDKVCLFCGKEKKKYKQVNQKLISCETLSIGENIRRYAETLSDDAMLAKVVGVDLVAKEIHYHAMCRNQYQRRAELHEKPTMSIRQPKNHSTWHKSRETDASAMAEIVAFVNEKIIKNKEVFLLTDLQIQYKQLLIEIGGEEYEETCNTAQHLEEKLLKSFGSEIIIDNNEKHHEKLVYSSSIDMNEAARNAMNNKHEIERKLKEVAFLLRKSIFHEKKNKLPESPTLKDILDGETAIPHHLNTFFEYLICGPNKNSSKIDVNKIRAKSLSQDTIFAVTNGKVKPSKHLKIGMAIKSLTGKREVLELLNKLGHTSSYTVIEELETELTFAADNNERLLPNEMSASGNVSTGLAFDNYDQYVETSSGKGTLHDTVAIAYQDEITEEERLEEIAGIENI